MNWSPLWFALLVLAKTSHANPFFASAPRRKPQAIHGCLEKTAPMKRSHKSDTVSIDIAGAMAARMKVHPGGGNQ
jgi:hypothetical protein